MLDFNALLLLSFRAAREICCCFFTHGKADFLADQAGVEMTTKYFRAKSISSQFALCMPVVASADSAPRPPLLIAP